MKIIFLFLNDNKTISFSFFVVSSIYFFSGIFFGIDFSDGFYHINQALDPVNNIHLYPFFLSSIIIKLLVEIVGPEIIHLRIVNSSLLYFSILLPFFLNKVNFFKPKPLYFISIILVLFAPFNANILGYDSLSIFILSLIFSVTIIYVRVPKYYTIILLSILSAVAIMIRMPNVIVIPVLLIAIVLNELNANEKFSRRTYTRSLGFLLLTILWVFLGYIWYYPGIEEFIQASATTNSHNFEDLMKNYLADGVQIISFILLIIGGFFLNKFFNKHFSATFGFGFFGISFFLFIAFFVAFSKYSQKYSFLLTAFAVTITLMQIFYHRKKPFGIQNIVLYLFLLFLFINPFGSDTGLLKATSLVILLPFILTFVNFRLNNFCLLIIAISIPFSLLENFYRTYEDWGILALDKKLKKELLYPIHTTEIRSEYLVNVDLEVKQLMNENVKVFFYGDKSHIFHYLYPGTDLNIKIFFQPLDDLIFYPHIKHVIKENSKVAVFLIDSYPGKELNGQSKIGTELENDGFKKINRESISYYFKY